ncbi:kinase-like protein [Colletotrichum sublineola]|nr:kinase-like protein [Colletotrichum sublineola]
MATATRRRSREAFEIHQDPPHARTEDTEMMADSEQHTEELDQDEEADDVENDPSDESSDEDDVVDSGVQRDMDRLQDTFPGFRQKYRLIKRIGEGTFSTVYKAEDIQYDRYDNDWDIEERDNPPVKWTPPPLKHHGSHTSTSREPRRRARYVAIKKIYVTSSPTRILNELELLHDLRNCPAVCPLITAFRSTDQVIAILPYFRHEDFRDYFRQMKVSDMAIYLRSLFTALKAVHEHKILHRDIKPTNFLYDPQSRRGVLVDFGLAEREGSDSKPCLCHESREVRKQRITTSAASLNGPQQGYPKTDTRPSRRANRAGTRGFRAPEVLFKCTEQTTKIDIWSAGVILLTIMSKRFPFFNSADDVEAMIEIATIFGVKRMRQAGLLHGCMFETNIPTVGSAGFSLGKIILWSTCRTDGGKGGQPGIPLTEEENLAVDFLERCMELDPARRISAKEALEHDFLKEPQPKQSVEPPFEDDDNDDDDEMGGQPCKAPTCTTRYGTRALGGYNFLVADAVHAACRMQDTWTRVKNQSM